MLGFDLRCAWQVIAARPFGPSASMMLAYVMASTLFAAASVHELLEGGRHWFAIQRAQLEAHLEQLMRLCEARTGFQRTARPTDEHYIPEAAHAQRLTEWPPLRMKTSWPGPAAVPRAP
ncbi:MAG: hypothetical protein ACK4WM_11015 [Thermoflexales bacterium]